METRALAKVGEELTSQLEEFRSKGANVLVPTLTIQEISPYHKPVVEIVKINPDPKAGEVYEVVFNSGDFSLRAVALMRIGYAVGLVWNARGCGRTDNGMNPNIVTYRAEAAVRKEDGTWMPLTAEYMLDLEIIEQETRDSYEKKSKDYAKKEGWSEDKRKDYIEKSLKRDMTQKRKFRLQLAQTGAMGVVVRKILGLKGTYKKVELEKPFIVPKIAFRPDVNDPKIREALLKQGMDATNLLFGAECGRGMLDYHPEVCETGKQTDTVSGEGQEAVPEAETASAPIDVTPQPAKQEPVVPFEKLDAAGQIRFLTGLIKRKNYDSKKMKRPLEQFSDQHRQMLYDHLNAMPDATEELPFE
ncbi:MAG: hypothetical protein EHM36_05305 [Deltaproteobacteria bacterium]|nr:MAG: hypothetical protein EHM36_05305 [Deltaproteobacteria bacterium]